VKTELEKNKNNSVLEHGKLIKVFSLLAALCIVIFYVGRGLTDKLAGLSLPWELDAPCGLGVCR